MKQTFLFINSYVQAEIRCIFYNFKLNINTEKNIGNRSQACQITIVETSYKNESLEKLSMKCNFL